MNKEKLLSHIIPVIVLIIGAIIATLYVTNPEQAVTQPKPTSKPTIVKTTQLKAGRYTVKVEAMGQVIPAVKIALKARVNGEITKTNKNFLPGGHFKAGDAILHIDPEDYKIAMQKQQAIYNQANADFSLEMGQQEIAKKELALLTKITGKSIEKPALALRAPQLARAAAELKKARSDLATAKLNVRRTTIKAPFNALVTKREATFGEVISTQNSLATLVSTDEYWVDISVPINQLQWLNIPRSKDDTGSTVEVLQDGGRGSRSGTLINMTGTIDTRSRLASLLVSVLDPLLLDAKHTQQNIMPLIIGDYVKVVLNGKTLDKAFRIPLSQIHDGNVIWLAESGKLHIKQIMPVYEDRTFAYITSDLKDGDVIVTSDIAAAINGMKIMVPAKKQLSSKPVKKL
jgi:RND family efflux transporter MFP subunit